jgi:hypothetical protein
MAKTKDIIREAQSLPIEGRVLVVDSLLRSLNPPDSKIDRKWAGAAKRRLSELQAGRAEPIPGNKVFSRVNKRFEK